MKTLCLFAAALALALSCSVRAGEEFSLKLGHVMSAAHPYHMGAVRFAELVKERTGGRVAVEVYPASQLGGEREGIEALQMGTLDFQMTATAPLANFNDQTIVFDLPFIFEDRFHARRVLDSEYGEGKLKNLEQFGLVGLSFFENTYFDICASRPAITPDAMEGMTIRVLEMNILMEFMRLLGANPVPMAWSEVPTAIQNGTIDALHGAFTAIWDLKLYDKMHFTFLDILYTPVPLLASKAIWDTLPAEFHPILKQAAKEAAEYQRKWYDDNFEKVMVDEARAGGLTTHQGDKAAWIEKTVKPLYTQFVGEGKTISPEDVKAINTFRKTPAVYEP